MSTQTKENLEILMKAAIVILLSITSFFSVRSVDKLDTTYESVIRLEVRLNNLEEELKRLRK